MKSTLRKSAFFLILIAITMSAMALQSRPNATAIDQVFACFRCNQASEKPTKCSKHGMMQPIHAKIVYHCKSCKTAALKSGNCPKCGKFVSKMARTYYCSKDQYSSKINIKCAKCKGSLKEHVMPVSN